MFIGQVSGQMAAGAGAQGNETVCLSRHSAAGPDYRTSRLIVEAHFVVSAAGFSGQKKKRGAKHGSRQLPG